MEGHLTNPCSEGVSGDDCRQYKTNTYWLAWQCSAEQMFLEGGSSLTPPLPGVVSHRLTYIAVLSEPVPFRLIKCSYKTESDLVYPKRTVSSYGQPQTLCCESRSWISNLISLYAHPGMDPCWCVRGKKVIKVFKKTTSFLLGRRQCQTRGIMWNHWSGRLRGNGKSRQCKGIRHISCGDFEDIDFSGNGNVSVLGNLRISGSGIFS